MCDGTPKFVIDIHNLDKRYGLVRSHEAWPWMYSSDNMPATPRECNKTFYPHLESREKTGYTRVAISVLFLDIRPEYETLLLESNGATEELTQTDPPFVREFPAQQTVVLSLKKTPGARPRKMGVGGSGFVICFMCKYWLDLAVTTKIQYLS